MERKKNVMKNIVKIKDVQYLKNGKIYWLSDNFESLFVLNHAMNYKTLSNLFEDYGKSSDIANNVELLGWSFGQTVCSAFTYQYNNKEMSVFDWDIIWFLLLFSENGEVSDTFSSFLQKNLILEHFSPENYILSAILILSNPLVSNIREKYLQNFLDFLKLERTIKNDLLFECLKTNDYNPLIKYLRNLIEL